MSAGSATNVINFGMIKIVSIVLSASTVDQRRSSTMYDLSVLC